MLGNDGHAFLFDKCPTGVTHTIPVFAMIELIRDHRGKRICVTGGAGFIGSHLTERLLGRGDEVVGLDNLNDYYDPSLKQARLARTAAHAGFTDVRMDLEDRQGIADLFAKHQPDAVVNLAAQAGVRYSIENPCAYVDTNLVGFIHILEGCRHNGVKHLVYASSSSVYGANTTMPFSVHDNVDHPLSLYAASKKANELMAHTYSHLFSLPTTGLRFFTVYGPRQRPEMAIARFLRRVRQGRAIPFFGDGTSRRDYTYIDDILNGITACISRNFGYEVFNLGTGKGVSVLEAIKSFERVSGKKLNYKIVGRREGDIEQIWADPTFANNELGWKAESSLDDAMTSAWDWEKKYRNKN